MDGATAQRERDLVFVSYSHKHPVWRERLEVFLKPWVRNGQLVVWADPYIKVGDRWLREIRAALQRTRVGVVLVSQDLLASDFIVEEELPLLLEAARDGAVTLICVPVSATTLQAPLPEARLLEFQWPRPPDQPLNLLADGQWEQALAEITTEIVAAAGSTTANGGPRHGGGDGNRRAVEPVWSAGDTARLGTLHGVPAQRLNYIERTADLARLKHALLTDAHGAVGITGTTQRMGLHGPGGIGKSVLAIALANDPEVRRAFPDGVFWVPVGQQPDLVELQTTLARALGDPSPTITSTHAGRELLRERWGNRAGLLILDDLWVLAHAEAFEVVSGRSRVLVTTRDGGLVTAIGAHEERIDTLDATAAVGLLARWVDTDPAAMPAAASEVARECGYLPLALSVAGALVRDGTPWADLEQALRAGKVRFLEHPSGDVFASMRLSVDFLPEPARSRYLELAVFPEEEEIPEATICRLWARTGNLADYESRRLLQDFARKGLLYLDRVAAVVSFHDLQHDFLRLVADDVKGLHDRLVAAYTTPPPAPAGALADA